MNLNEVALMIIVIAPFVYLMTNNSIKCKRHLNRKERGNGK